MEYFLHLPDFRLISCRKCNTGLLRRRIKLHLRSPPHKLTKQEIKKAQKWAAALDIIDNDDEIHGLSIPPDSNKPIQALGEPRSGGFRCEFTPECLFVSSDLRGVRKHLRVEHNWGEKLKGGRRSAAQAEAERADMPWRSGVLYQRFFNQGPKSQLFEVARGLDIAGLIAEKHEEEVGMEEARHAFQAKAKDIRNKEMKAVEEQGDLAAPNPWLRRLGATTHLKHFSDKKVFLRGLISLHYSFTPDDPDAKDDAALRHIHAAVKRLIRKAGSLTRPNVVSWNVLFEVNRKELHKERSTPFHFRFKRPTRKKYIDICLQLFAYAIRAMACENTADRPPFKLTIKQTETFTIMLDYANELVTLSGRAGGRSTSSRVKELYALLEEAALAFYISMLNHFTKTTEYDSILVSFLMVLCIRADNTWESYSSFTSKLSGIMAISRVLLVKYTVDKRLGYIRRRVSQGQTQEEAEEKSPGHFEIMSDMTRRFMVGGAQGWDTTPVQFIIRLRNYGMATDANMATTGSVSWDREDAIYRGI